jgi:hypothetical protein
VKAAATLSARPSLSRRRRQTRSVVSDVVVQVLENLQSPPRKYCLALLAAGCPEKERPPPVGLSMIILVAMHTSNLTYDCYL